MSNLGQDIKSGLKGIRGAGEAIRGTFNEAADQALDTNQKHPAAQESQLKNRGIAEKGKEDIRGADDMIARHEWKHKGVAPPATAAQTAPVTGQQTTMAGTTAGPTAGTTDGLGSTAPATQAGRY
ncbi:hypothetical protein JX265_001504 [Neoarthrinium moseri]|uniref:Uncharacterized protein n=1 Tax=Neoarthrinium moseri TaxID=1658444 RepID=A0A9P9WVL2_9PEZI|nr:uncharacterized protein JN550_003899 [Neoarthrinium moseri]KAI1841428.1 hypothetical protein JX266_012357 [Neoarthrinium moseri]KAI1872180.1 hypothetical protein JN550_003899 [Neoarthrinium moseri]KAI1879883.1 hypothetical protein JX265_001504 [Neoarthrinium moseri]